jgi:hypothetical protein
MNNRGINKSIFNKTDNKKRRNVKEKESKKNLSAGPGRPVKHDEPTKKITVVFGEGRFVEINEICFDILKKHNKKVSMTELIRGITEAVLDSDINIEQATNEHEINELISHTIARGKNEM